MSSIITCDLGSNSFRLAEFDIKTKEKIQNFEIPIGLGLGLSIDGMIHDDAICRLLNVIELASKTFDFKNKKTICVTTQAMRKAKNAKDVQNFVFQKTGLWFEIIEAKDEARITNLAIHESISKIFNSTITKYWSMDIGGGSTEISYINKDETVFKSFDFGIITLAQLADTKSKMQNILEEYKKQINSWLKSFENQTSVLIATAGTPTTVAAIIKNIPYEQYDGSKITGSVVTTKQYEEIQEKLSKMNALQQEYWTGTNRGSLIVAGISLVIMIMDVLKTKESIVIDEGLREGLAFDFIKNQKS